MEVTMISRGVEISIAGGVEETKDDLNVYTFCILYRHHKHALENMIKQKLRMSGI